MFKRDAVFNILFWLLYFLYEWLGLASLYGDYEGYFINACMALPVAVIFSVLMVHVFFKRLYLPGKKVWFCLGLISASFLLLLVRRYFNYYVIYPRYFPFALQMPLFSAGKFLVDTVNLYVVAGLYALYYSVDYWYQARHKMQELMQQQTRAELDLLKSQVQPHFVFNTLNNIYGTALEKSPETATLIAHLSNFLSYNIYDASKPDIPLTEEIEYITHYLALQKHRFADKFDVVIDISNDTEQLRIAPLLLLPLVENCFKHGVENSNEKSWIRIDVSNQRKYFSISFENSTESPASTPTGNKGGIGLVNVKKRLQLTYPNRHNLTIKKGINTYLVTLTIQLAG